MADNATTLSNDLLAKLRETRCDYEEEKIWHKFLLDAANGTGGFKGRYGPTSVSILGWAASAYGYTVKAGSTMQASCDSYLDQFTREDTDRFNRRRNVAHYTNYVGPIHELLISYVNAEDLHRDLEPEAVAEWRKNVDGNGTDWDTMQRDVLRPLASELGWLPVMFDMPAAPEPGLEISKAESDALGLVPRAIPLFPANLLYWITDDSGEFIAAKVRIEVETQDDLLSLPGREERYWLWYRDRVSKYVVRTTADGVSSVEDLGETTHTWGCVPIVIFRGKPTPGDKVRGMSNIGDLAVEARAHFNLSSEKRDHIRGQVFAVLGIPMMDTSKDVGSIVAGNHGALRVPAQGNIMLHYVAPPASVAETLAAALDVSVKEMHRIARVEYEDVKTAGAVSGVARAYQFGKTNKRLADMAAGFARADQKALRLVGKALNAADAELLKTTAPTDFQVDDLATDIENVLQSLQIGLGPTADAEIKKRTARKLMPNMPQAKLDDIDEEIDEAVLQEERDAAMQKEAEKAAAAAALDASKNPENVVGGGVPGKEQAV